MNYIVKSIAAAGFLAVSSMSLEARGVGFLTQPLAPEVWETSQWISVADAPVVKGRVNDGTRAADGASCFVANQTNARKVKSAKWMTSGLGVYNLYVNGSLIGEEVLKPGFTHPYKTRRSFTYDITDALNKAKGQSNQFFAEVTPGWWSDKIVTPGGHEGMVGERCAFRGVVVIVYDDGTKACIPTDTKSWTSSIAGPVTHAAIFDGEVYDARILAPYSDTSGFATPIVNTEFNGEVLPTDGAEIYLREDLALDPVKAYTWKSTTGESAEQYGRIIVNKEYAPGEKISLKPGEKLVVDFGQNCAAVPRFLFNANGGTTLKCEASELLNDGNGAKSRGMDGPEGSTHRLNLRIPREGMYVQYTFADSDSPVSFTPVNTFMGYRYITITADDDVVIDKIQSIPVTSIAQSLETGEITTGNDLINKLISNTIWGQRSNYLSVPTDCPQRNERLGWTADTQVFAETGTFFANTKPFFHKWMRDMRDSQSDNGGYPGVAPLAQYGGEVWRLGWADAGIIVPWTVFKQYGDTAIVGENWESMNRYIDHLAEVKANHEALAPENGNYEWADWLSYEPLESCSGRAFGPNGPLPETLDYWNYLYASYWLMDAEMMRDMAVATGRDAKKYEKMASEARKHLLDTFFDKNGEFKTALLNEMQTPALFALKNNLFEGKKKENMIARLRKNFADHDNCLQTGFLGTSILMPTLTDNGMSDIAYELLFQRKNPSWLYSVDNGATTIWERWNSYMLDSGMGPQGMNSFNHYAYGCVCQWLWQTAAGIASDPERPGFEHIIMSPVPDARLGHLDATYRTPLGEVKSSWKYTDKTWNWKFTIPKGATATVTLPGQTQSKTYTSGSYDISLQLPL